MGDILLRVTARSYLQSRLSTELSLLTTSLHCCLKRRGLSDLRSSMCLLAKFLEASVLTAVLAVRKCVRHHLVWLTCTCIDSCLVDPTPQSPSDPHRVCVVTTSTYHHGYVKWCYRGVY